jgi:hypothetical protein
VGLTKRQQTKLRGADSFRYLQINLQEGLKEYRWIEKISKDVKMGFEQHFQNLILI